MHKFEIGRLHELQTYFLPVNNNKKNKVCNSINIQDVNVFEGVLTATIIH